MRFLLVAIFCALCGCVPSGDEKTQSTASAAEVAAGAETEKCLADGGNDISFDVGLGGTGHACMPPNSEAERKRNLSDRAFAAKCDATEGFVLGFSDVEPACILRDSSALKTCKSSSDCAGVCMKDNAQDGTGTCVAARPLLGCFTELGQTQSKRICAE